MKGRFWAIIGAIAGVLLASRMAYEKVKDEKQDAEPEKYSEEWIKQLSDQEWEIERDKVRIKSLSSELSSQEIDYYERIRRRFDKVKTERDWNGETPRAPSYSREHGYNLYKPE